MVEGEFWPAFYFFFYSVVVQRVRNIVKCQVLPPTLHQTFQERAVSSDLAEPFLNDFLSVRVLLLERGSSFLPQPIYYSFSLPYTLRPLLLWLAVALFSPGADWNI